MLVGAARFRRALRADSRRHPCRAHRNRKHRQPGIAVASLWFAEPAPARAAHQLNATARPRSIHYRTSCPGTAVLDAMPGRLRVAIARVAAMIDTPARLMM